MKLFGEEMEGYYQSKYPLLHLNHSISDVEDENIGYSYGVTVDGIPFEAELWKDNSAEGVVFYLPYIFELFENEDEPLRDPRTGGRVFSYDTVMSGNMVLMVGLVDDGMVESLSVLDAYAELLVTSRLLSYKGDMRNGAAFRLVDYDGNDVIAFNVTLAEEGELLATTPLEWTPFIERTDMKSPIFTRVK